MSVATSVLGDRIRAVATEVQGRGDRPDPEQDQPVPVEHAHAIDRRTEQGIRHIFRPTVHFIIQDLLPKNEPDPGLVDLRSVMDDGRILIVNLRKGRIGDDACHLLGSLVVTALQHASHEPSRHLRADISERGRRDFWLYADEFQNFATESFATILSEGGRAAAGTDRRLVGELPLGWNNPLSLGARILLR